MADASEHLSATTEAYERVAIEYAEIVRGEFDGLPLDRAVLAAFAEYVRTDGPGLVAELGCGPGRVTAHLRDLGMEVFGVDLSPAMIEIARREHPGLKRSRIRRDRPDAARAARRGTLPARSPADAPPHRCEVSFGDPRDRQVRGHSPVRAVEVVEQVLHGRRVGPFGEGVVGDDVGG